jgi:uncharacterized protein DUF4236
MSTSSVARRPAARVRRRPRLEWTAIPPREIVKPPDLEWDVVAVLVGLLEWARSAGVDFDAAIAKARVVEAQRAFGGKVSRLGLYLRKSFRLGPLRLNVSSYGVGLSVGVKGARFGVDAGGHPHAHVGRQRLLGVVFERHGRLIVEGDRVFKLMTNSNLVGCSAGRLPGLAPFRILSTNTAARRRKCIQFVQ